MTQFYDYETYQWHNSQYQNNSFSNTYDFDWRHHPYAYDQYYQNPYQNRQNQYQNQCPSQNDWIEKKMENFIALTKQFNIELRQQHDMLRKDREAWNAMIESNTTRAEIEQFATMSSLCQFDELPIKPQSNSREHDHAMTMEVEIVHEGQSRKVEQIDNESPEKEDEYDNNPTNLKRRNIQIRRNEIITIKRNMQIITNVITSQVIVKAQISGYNCCGDQLVHNESRGIWSYKKVRRRWEREKVADLKEVRERGGLRERKMIEAYEAREREGGRREGGGREEGLKRKKTYTKRLEFGKRIKLLYHSGRMGTPNNTIIIEKLFELLMKFEWLG